ncbi:MAG: Crp/Fnr family transcriptional regulator [Sphingomonadales bacterium]|nr:Crp/Fnr family transcriptional regulator [Sphingomonadales bacterium]
MVRCVIPDKKGPLMLSRQFLMGRHREDLSATELAALEDAAASVTCYGAREEMVHHGDEVTHAMLLVEGFVCRYMDGLDGDRQLVALHVPGDFVDLHGFPLRKLDHDIASLTEVKVANYPHSALSQLILDHPNLGRMLWFSTLLDAAMHREWIFRLGRLGAIGRVAHFFAEIGRRLQMVDLSDGCSFPLPLHQSDLAEACGITAVHANRVLRELRERKIVTFKGGQVVVSDILALHAVAEFDDGYLYPSGH